jgi:aconitate hydratase
MTTRNTFGTRARLSADGRDFEIQSLEALERQGYAVARLPFSLKILLENLLRHEDGRVVRAEDVEALARWSPEAAPEREIAFTPARVLLQDFTGVPAVVDLAAMRAAMRRMGGDPARINPLQPVELVIDHSVQVDEFGTRAAFETNAELEYRRNRERYVFLRWGQRAFQNFRVVPPETGIVHQVNLEYLARVIFRDESDDSAADDPAGRGGPGGRLPRAYPDTLVGTDSHTTMVNGLGVLGWGVGGIEAEAAMLGQPVSMLIPRVVGMRLSGELPEGATATDLVLRVTELLRAYGVVGKFVEFYGPGLERLPLADRATIANMAPEYGATCGIFPIGEETIRYLRFTGRSETHVRLVEAYARAQGLYHTVDSPEPGFAEALALDLATVEPALAGPRRPQDRVPLAQVKAGFLTATRREEATPRAAVARLGDADVTLRDGAVVIAAITSCTNTSNPSVMVAAGLLAKKAVERGLATRPWVKPSLAPGSKVVTDYLADAGLTTYLERLGFYLVGYGCTTCIGNSGPLPEPVSAAIQAGDLVAVAVLSGNRNFEGRINPDVRANYLASPPLVVAYALAGRIDFDPLTEPIGTGSDGTPVFLRDIWPTRTEVEETMRRSVRPEMFQREYAEVFEGDGRWRELPTPADDLFAWSDDSTYVREPPYFLQMPARPEPVTDVRGARVLALLGDSVTTDHISPAGSIKQDSPAGRYLLSLGIAPRDFNSYGSRRGNHEVMVRGTFANIRLRNRLVPGVEGGYTSHFPDGEQTTIYDAAMKYAAEATPLIVIAGKEYGTGSSRDWAAKGTLLLGVRAVLAESFERIHRSNLVGMGVLPLQFAPGESASTLGLTGTESYDILGLAELMAGGIAGTPEVHLVAHGEDGSAKSFLARVRIDTPQELEYYRHGGILPYVLRQLLRTEAVPA